MEREERFDATQRVVRVSLVATLLLMAAKLLAGHYGRSAAVFADGIESASDLVATGLAMAAVAVGRRRQDEAHPYGHGKAESLAALAVSFFIVAGGGIILYGAVSSMVAGAVPVPGTVAVATAAATIGIKEILYRYTSVHARFLQSPSLHALADDHRKDALSSIATVIGVCGAWLGATWMDPAAAALTSIIILRIGCRTFRTAAHELMDGLPDRSLLEEVKRVAEGVPGVEHVHDIRGRRSGQYVIIDLKLDMDPEMTVMRSHQVGDRVREVLFRTFPNIGEVMIHVNPHDVEHTDMSRL